MSFVNEPVLELRRAPVRESLLEALRTLDARPPLSVPVLVGGDRGSAEGLDSTDPGAPSRLVARATRGKRAEMAVDQQLSGRGGGLDPIWVLQQGTRLGEGRDGQAVPRRDDLVVTGRGDPLGPRGQQPIPYVVVAPLVTSGRVLDQLQHRRATLEGARGGDGEQLSGPLAVALAQHLAQFLGRPDVEPTLLPLAVGVQSRGEAALGRTEVAQHPAGSLLHDPTGQR